MPLDDEGIDGSIDTIDATPDAPPTRLPTLRGFSRTHASTNVTSVAVPTPANIIAGDLLLAHVSYDSATVANIQTPNGWTRIHQQFTGSVAAALFTKRAGSEANHTFTFAMAAAASVFLVGFEGVDEDQPVNAVLSTTSTGDTTAEIPAIVTTVPQTLLLAILTQDIGQSTYTAPMGMTLIYNEGSGDMCDLAAMEPRPMVGTTGDRVAVSTASGPSIGFAVALAPR